MLHPSQGLDEKCSGATIFLDTNVFVLAAKHTELLTQLKRIVSTGSVFATTTSVVFEYTRGAQSLEELILRRKFIEGITERIMPIGSLFESEKNDAFSAVMSLVVKRGDSHYTDFLLAVALHRFMGLPERIYVLSADAKAFPLALFDIEGVVSLDNDNGSIAHLYLIALNRNNYTSLLSKVQREGSIN